MGGNPGLAVNSRKRLARQKITINQERLGDDREHNKREYRKYI